MSKNVPNGIEMPMSMVMRPKRYMQQQAQILNDPSTQPQSVDELEQSLSERVSQSESERVAGWLAE